MHKIQMHVDPVMTRLLHTGDVQYFNRLRGVTMGKHRKESAFGCEMHVDSTNRFCVSENRKFKDAIESALITAKACSATKKQSVNLTANYLLSFLKFYAGGKPTTVTYAEIPKDPSYRPPTILMEEPSNLEQLFVHDGMKFVFPIQHRSHLVFYAYTHRHGSSLAIETFPNGDVRTRNDYDRHMFAFGFAA